jgi:hypothetical protein
MTGVCSDADTAGAEGLRLYWHARTIDTPAPAPGPGARRWLLSVKADHAWRTGSGHRYKDGSIYVLTYVCTYVCTVDLGRVLLLM